MRAANRASGIGEGRNREASPRQVKLRVVRRKDPTAHGRHHPDQTVLQRGVRPDHEPEAREAGIAPQPRAGGRPA